MIYQEMKIVDGVPKVITSKVIDQSTLTSDCWLVQFNGLSACEKCKEKGKRSCGGGKTLKKIKQEASKGN
jgi:hypothetical protein